MKTDKEFSEVVAHILLQLPKDQWNSLYAWCVTSLDVGIVRGDIPPTNIGVIDGRLQILQHKMGRK